ncbi:hypothetical protein [Lacticaseibacillus salsurivasis]|uniref:hypothetical protein n=1 Tax=Lacticaseibacillus salsurivasis TaxID=3081441 RepID=UPI0030C748C4
MTSETKQDVFDEAVAALEYARQQKDGEGSGNYRARYAAASDGDSQCPYCRITADGIQKMIICEKRFDDEYLDVVRIDPKDQKLSMEFMADVYNPNEGEVTTDDVEHKETIHFCPMCGRRLEASHEPA